MSCTTLAASTQTPLQRLDSLIHSIERHAGQSAHEAADQRTPDEISQVKTVTHRLIRVSHFVAVAVGPSDPEAASEDILQDTGSSWIHKPFVRGSGHCAARETPHLSALWLPADQVGEISKPGSGRTGQGSLSEGFAHRPKPVIPEISAHGVGKPAKDASACMHTFSAYGLFQKVSCRSQKTLHSDVSGGLAALYAHVQGIIAVSRRLPVAQKNHIADL